MANQDVIDTTTQIPTNLRLLMLLEEVARAGVPVTPSVVNETLGLPKPTFVINQYTVIRARPH